MVVKQNLMITTTAVKQNIKFDYLILYSKILTIIHCISSQISLAMMMIGNIL